jgi:hypothetical protein
MHVIPIKQPGQAHAVRWLVVLCLALLSLTAAAQVLHFHADDFSGIEKHCPICSVLHSATPLPHAVQLDFAFQTTALLQFSANPDQRSFSLLFALFSRPPPAL